MRTGVLFVAEGLDGVEGGGFSGGVETEEEADGYGEPYREGDEKLKIPM